ncbi:MAG: protein kinase [Alistipes sp.]|nr:protein kinase [Alistipes sp.]
MDTTVRYTASDDLRSGVELQGGRYRIISTLGRGGFGITYLAEQVNVRRKVCIKEFFPKAYYRRDGDSGAITLSSDGFAELMSKFKDKFIKEAYTIAELDHPNIIRIHDVFEENSTAYYVMEYIDGESSQSKVNSSGAMAESAAHEYIKQVAAALDHVHSQQIMHLDVKPGNVMVRAKDNRAILIDFGLSKHYDAESGDATSTTIVGVSHGYAPMEQYKEGGISSFSPSTDIYSLGATLYFLVVGKTPPSADVVGEDGIGALPSGLSRGTRSAIECAMQHRRKDRPQSIADFLALLGGKGKPVTPVPSTHKKRSNWWLWLLLLLLIAVGGFVGYMMSGGDEPVPTPTPEPIPETVVEAEPVIEEQSEESTASAETVVVEPAPAPNPIFTLAKSSLTVDSSGGSHSVGYTIEHPIDGASVSVSDNQSWITNLSASGGKITFKIADNTSAESRTGTITATYNGITRQISITQEKGVRTYSIGDYYNENGKRGVVFQVWDGGRHGKIISLDETRAAWDSRVKYDSDKYEFVEGTGTRTYADSESNGKANTDKIMARSDSEYFDAFKWCRAKGSSWYLPARDELMQIYNNMDKLNSTLSQYGTALSDSYYWSSTEYVDYKPEFCAWRVNMYGGYTRDSNMYNHLYVRAVSAF